MLHKIRYSKTLKGDLAGALLGLIAGLFVGYLALSSVGSVSIDLADLTCLTLWVFLALSSAAATTRFRWSDLRCYPSILLIPISEFIEYRVFMSIGIDELVDLDFDPEDFETEAVLTPEFEERRDSELGTYNFRCFRSLSTE